MAVGPIFHRGPPRHEALPASLPTGTWRKWRKRKPVALLLHNPPPLVLDPAPGSSTLPASFSGLVCSLALRTDPLTEAAVGRVRRESCRAAPPSPEDPRAASRELWWLPAVT